MLGDVAPEFTSNVATLANREGYRLQRVEPWK
jgi:hypothetical protein